MNAGLAAIAVLWRRDLYHFVREPMRVVASVAQPLLFWVLLGSGFGRGLLTAGGSYSSFFFPGMVLLVVLFACIFSTISVIDDRQQGFLRAVLVERERGHELVPRLVEAFPGRARSVTLRQPTLEDVFVHVTGKRFRVRGST